MPRKVNLIYTFVLILASNELVFVNFYADWCRFSQMLQPIFDDTAKKVKELFPVSSVFFTVVWTLLPFQV